MQQHEWWQTKKWPTLTQMVSAKLYHKTWKVIFPFSSHSQLRFFFLLPGWKLNPVVGAVYGPELYAGKRPTASAVRLLSVFLSTFHCMYSSTPEATISRNQSQSDPWISTIGLILNLLNMKFPSNQSESESGPDKQWMIQAPLSGWGSLSHCLRGVQL